MAAQFRELARRIENRALPPVEAAVVVLLHDNADTNVVPIGDLDTLQLIGLLELAKLAAMDSDE